MREKQAEFIFKIYILNSKINNKKHYIGHSNNLKDRLKSHNAGKVKSTKPYRPWKIIYTETFDSKTEAYKREMQIKSYKGGKAFKQLIE